MIVLILALESVFAVSLVGRSAESLRNAGAADFAAWKRGVAISSAGGIGIGDPAVDDSAQVMDGYTLHGLQPSPTDDAIPEGDEENSETEETEPRTNASKVISDEASETPVELAPEENSEDGEEDDEEEEETCKRSECSDYNRLFFRTCMIFCDPDEVEKDQDVKKSTTLTNWELSNHTVKLREEAQALEAARAVRAQENWLSIGWLAIDVIALCCCFIVSFGLKTVWSQSEDLLDGESALREGGSGYADKVYSFLDGDGFFGSLVLRLSVLLTVANFWAYAAKTTLMKYDKSLREVTMDPSLESPWWVNYLLPLENVSNIFFILLILLRVVFASGDPRCRSSIAPQLRLFCTDVYLWFDVLAVTPWIVDTARFFWGMSDIMPNAIWLRFPRLLEIFLNSKLGIGFSVFAEIWRCKGVMIMKVCYVGFTCWVLLSGLYYWTEKTSTIEDIKWGGFHRYGSIPSAMYYTLINLEGEYPIADALTAPGGRLVGLLTLIFGKAIIAVPFGVLGSCFYEEVEKNHNAYKEEETRRWSRTLSETHDPGDERLIRLMRSRPFHVAVWFGFLASAGIFVYATTLNPIQPPAPNEKSDEAVWKLMWLRAFDSAIGFFFLAEYVIRIRVARTSYGSVSKYLKSPYGLMDLMAWLPSTIAVFLLMDTYDPWNAPFIKRMPLVLHACTMIRIIKVDRTVGVLSRAGQVVEENKGVFATTLVCGAFVHTVASVLFYYAERANDDEEVRKNFDNVPAAMWMTLLDLTGESPLSDHTAQGKAIHAVVIIIGVGLFTIPMSIFGCAFHKQLSEDYVPGTVLDDSPVSSLAPNTSFLSSADRRASTWSNVDVIGVFSHERLREFGETRQEYRRQLFHFLMGYRHKENGFVSIAYELVVVAAILVGTTSACFATLDPETYPYSVVCKDVLVYCMAISTFDFVLRVIAWSPYLCSFLGIADIVAIIPFWLVKLPYLPHKFQDFLREDLVVLFTVTRLVALDAYFPSVSLLWEALQTRMDMLLESSVVLIIVWVLFSTSNHVLERQSMNDEDAEEIAAVMRDWSTCMAVSLVHLTGDYPLTAYCPASRVVHAVALLTAWSFVGIPAGIFASAFQEVFKDYRKAAAKAKTIPEDTPVTVSPSDHHAIAAMVHERLMNLDPWFSLILMCCSPIIVCCELVLTVDVAHVEGVLKILQGVAGVVVLLHYLAWLVAAPDVPQYRFSRLAYVMSARSLLHLFTLSTLALSLLPGGRQNDATAATWQPLLVAAQLCWLFHLEQFVDSSPLMMKAFRNSAALLWALTIVVTVIWILTAAAWYTLERDADGTWATSMPATLFYTGIFLHGEWCEIGFASKWSYLLCVFYCVFAVGVMAMPCGLMTECFAEEADKDLQKKDAHLNPKAQRPSTKGGVKEVANFLLAPPK